MSMKTCPFCGQTVDENLKFCPRCGNSLEAFRQGNPQGSTPYVSPNSPETGAQTPYSDAFTEAPQQVSAWFVCPKCGASHEVYGDGVNPPKFGVCYNCGYREGDYLNPTTAPDYSMREMPSRGTYTTFLVFGFIFGVLWGLLALNNYRRMNVAINGGDADTAWANARKVRMFFFIGLAVNVGVFVLTILGNLVG